ncbi:MAG: hypothetical protein QW678_03530 [Candidatus Aenigmatarchaeota archaeon]
MVSKELFLVLIIFFLFLFFNLIIEKSSACLLVQGTFFNDSSCRQPIGNLKDFTGGVSTGCVMAYFAGQFYEIIGMYENITCSSRPEAKWYDSPSYNGQICKRRDGWDCLANVKEGVYDASQDICVICDGKIQIEMFGCGFDNQGDYRCESACGADKNCDEVAPATISYKDSSIFCNSTCEAIYCNEENQCVVKIDIRRNLRVFCVYSYTENKWLWIEENLINLEDGNPVEECFDGIDNDCNGKRDCEEPGCAGARNPSNPWDICCQTDDDCPVCSVKDGCPYIDGVKGKCESNKCVWGKCYYNEDCAEGYCCTDDPSGPKTWEGKCVPKGTIINKDGKSFICDPPDEIVQNNKSNNIIFNLFNYISNLLNQFFFHKQKRS